MKSIIKRGNKKDYSYLINKGFGDWTVLGEDRTLTQQNGLYKRFKLKCQCKCGTIGLVDYHNLVRGQTTKCYKCRIHFKAPFNALLASYKQSAKKRNLEWAISPDTFKEICLRNCSYCNCKPSNCLIVKECYGEFVHNGIDRIDSSVGYLEENCTSCCSVCNYMKQSLSVEDFLNHIKQIYEFKGLNS